MTDRLDKEGLTQFVDSVEATVASINSHLGDIRRYARQTRNEMRDQTLILERIAIAVESIDSKTKDKN